jgi:dienelactone hydrolase
MYKDIVAEGDACRLQYKNGFDNYIKRLTEEAYGKRDAAMPTEDLAIRLEEHRQRYIKMLGLDRIGTEGNPPATLTRVGEDEDAVIYRATVHITPEIPQYGLLFVPHGTLKAPLVIAQHGGYGTPELCSDLNGKNNYNHMVRRVLRRGAIVYAPQLLIWNFKEATPTAPSHNIPFQRNNLDKELKRFGLSITALEIKGIMNAITFLSELEYVDEDRIGMIGLSYGGYFTMHTMAADTRLKVGFSNACFNDRNVYSWQDWTYPDSANSFHDAEVAALCAPRKLYVAVGKEDTVFNYTHAIPESERAQKYFSAMGCPQNFIFTVWDGGHTLPSDDEGIDFIFSGLE